MTSTQEPPQGEGRDVHPLFASVAQSYLAQHNLDEPAKQLLGQLLVRGTREVLRLPEGADRDAAVEAAAERLNVAMKRASLEFARAGQVDIDIDTLTVVMQSLCPVPPFCAGISGPDSGVLSPDLGDASLRPQPELVEA